MCNQRQKEKQWAKELREWLKTIHLAAAQESQSASSEAHEQKMGGSGGGGRGMPHMSLQQHPSADAHAQQYPGSDQVIVCVCVCVCVYICVCTKINSIDLFMLESVYLHSSYSHTLPFLPAYVNTHCPPTYYLHIFSQK